MCVCVNVCVHEAPSNLTTMVFMLPSANNPITQGALKLKAVTGTLT